MGGLTGQGQQQQQQPRQQRGPLPPGQMGPPPPQQRRPQQGPPPPPKQTGGKFREFLQRDGVSQALMAMGANMLAQGPSDVPVGFGTMIGEGAQAGLGAYNKELLNIERKDTKALERKRQDVLDKRATTTFGNQQADRTRRHGREDVEDTQAAQTHANQQILSGQNQTRFMQDNIMFDLGLEDRGEDRANAMYDRNLLLGDQSQARERLNKQYAAMADPALIEGMNPEQQKVFKGIMPYLDPNIAAQYFSDVGESEEIDMTTNDMKNALFVARAQNPEATEQELQASAAELVQGKMVKPLTAVNTMNSPGSKGNQTFSEDIRTKAESSRETLGLLTQFTHASEGVNMGPFAGLMQESGTKARQLANMFGLEDLVNRDSVDQFFDTDLGKGAVLRGLGNRLALEMTNQLAGQISEKELTFAIESMPSLLLAPEGNKMLVAMLSAKADQDLQRAQFSEAQRSLETSAMPGDYPARMMKWDKENKLQLRDDAGNLTEYGAAMEEAGLFRSGEDTGRPDDDDPGWS